MSGLIHLLPDSLANQIAAGEVIQRPASVVKELLENALDAQASQVRLILKDSGKTMIQVVDNGRGMSEIDARLCFERHATSKISSSDDLFQIRSFGFRGEALASIAAVAQVDLKTNEHDTSLGTHIVIEGSTIKKQETFSVSPVSVFTVKNLFFNVPARRKFLKSDPVELKHILEEFARVALPNPSIHFSAHHNGNELYHFPPSNLRQRIVNYFGKSINEKIIPVSEQTDFLSISGFIGRPEFVKKTRGDQFIFVNRRYIKSNYLNHAIKTAYENMLPNDHFPFYVLLLEIDPSMIDINIHPTKQEIKFENERLIYNYVRVAIKHALGKYSITPVLDFDNANAQILSSSSSSAQSSGLSRITTSRDEKDQWAQFYKDMHELGGHGDPEPNAITLSSNWNESEERISHDGTDSKICFQIHDSFIISPIKSGVVVLDQQAAHERILYERFLSTLEEQKIIGQQSLFPEIIEVDAGLVEILRGLLKDLSYLGFDIEPYGMQNTFVIKAIPSSGLIESPKAFLIRFLEQYASETGSELEIRENIARSMAYTCRINKGHSLKDIEMQELIDQLFACEMPYTTPSGRKCFITFGLDELETRFKN